MTASSMIFECFMWPPLPSVRYRPIAGYHVPRSGSPNDDPDMTESSSQSANRKAREEKKQAYLRALFDRHAERFRAAGDGDARALARGAHAEIDEVLQRDRGRSAD